MKTFLAIALALGWTLLAAPDAARADSPGAGGDVSVAQSLGDRELTVVLRRVTGVPGPLRVDVIAHAGSSAGMLRLAVVPAGADGSGRGRSPSGVVTGRTSIALTGTPGAFPATLTVDRTGPWELTVDDGSRVARIPFVVSGQSASPPELAVYTGFTMAGAGLLAGLVLMLTRRDRWLLVPAAAGVVAGFAVAVTGALLSASLPLPPLPGRAVAATVGNAADPYAGTTRALDYSRPPATLLLDRTTVATGAAVPLGLRLVDAATGLPVDDLVVHDDALVHLMIVGPDGTLRHLHPVRTGPGTFAVNAALLVPGHYAVAAELARLGGGVQMARSATGLDVTGPARGPAAPAPMTGGTAVVDGTSVQLAVGTPVAGTPATLRARIGDTSDLQPWLGMLGHLIVVGPLAGGPSTAAGAAVWSHAHAMDSQIVMSGDMAMDAAAEPMVPMTGESLPDETVQAYGPTVGFTYVFPLPGRYLAWIQVERNYAVLTVPAAITVAAS